MGDFNGSGVPTEDKRLTLSGTTSAGRQQYRLWHDSQQILVPKGQSVTKPALSELVQANSGVFGSISKGYFRKPVYEARNTNDYKLFDRFHMQTFRYTLPEDTNIDWHIDLDIDNVIVEYAVEFSVATDDTGDLLAIDSGEATLEWHSDKNWVSRPCYAGYFENDRIEVDYFIATNPASIQISTGLVLPTGLFLQGTELDLFVIVTKAVAVVGNTKMDLLTKNTDFVVELSDFAFAIKRGE